MTQIFLTKCWNGHYTKTTRDASGYDYCTECKAIVVKRMVRRDPTKTTSVAEMFFVQ